jgi:hypothetical protein
MVFYAAGLIADYAQAEQLQQIVSVNHIHSTVIVQFAVIRME